MQISKSNLTSIQIYSAMSWALHKKTKTSLTGDALSHTDHQGARRARTSQAELRRCPCKHFLFWPVAGEMNQTRIVKVIPCGRELFQFQNPMPSLGRLLDSFNIYLYDSFSPFNGPKLSAEWIWAYGYYNTNDLAIALIPLMTGWPVLTNFCEIPPPSLMYNAK